jgi:cytochrome c-type biogenesis protein CcmE
LDACTSSPYGVIRGPRSLDFGQRMDPSRKRRIRLVVALTAALLLAGALAYTSFSASTEARTPSQLAGMAIAPGKTYELTGKVVAVDPSRLLASAGAGRSYQLTGKVVDGSIRKQGDATLFRVRDRNGRASVPVRYVGAVPDPFRDGREVIVTVRKRGATFVGEKDSLVTKCPSKFTDKQNAKT